MRTSVLRDTPAGLAPQPAEMPAQSPPLSRGCAERIHRPVDQAEVSVAGVARLRILRGTIARLSRWLQRWRDRRVTDRLYRALSRLSDAELARRGLRLATLAHDLRDLDAAGVKRAGEDRP